jgi:hypothetical protein
LAARALSGKIAMSARESPSVPDTLRFLLIIACLAGAVYGAAWALANFPPEQTEIVKSLPHERLRQQEQ